MGGRTLSGEERDKAVKAFAELGICKELAEAAADLVSYSRHDEWSYDPSDTRLSTDFTNEARSNPSQRDVPCGRCG